MKSQYKHNYWTRLQIDINYLKRSVGVGVRITIPMMGLMGLDYGWGLDEIPGNPDANIGQFHFSIGQTF